MQRPLVEMQYIRNAKDRVLFLHYVKQVPDATPLVVRLWMIKSREIILLW